MKHRSRAGPSRTAPAPALAPAAAPAFHPAARGAACVILLLFSLSLVSCEESAFGMSLPRFREIIAGSDPAPILELSERDLSSTGDLGPEALYYLGRWIEDRSMGRSGAEIETARSKAAFLYRRAWDRCDGTAGREAGRSLASALASLEEWEGLADFARERRDAEGPDWGPDRAGVDALAALGRDEELLAALAALRAAFPAESAAEADSFACLEARALRRLGRPLWPVAMRAALFERPATECAAAALAELESSDPPESAFSPAEYAAARMRVAVLRKDYGAAYREAQPFLDSILSPDSPPALVADAGKAFLYSDKAAEGLPLFAGLESKASGAAWHALFYRARLAAALERRAEAAELFRRAAAGALSDADADAALWYWVESASEAAKAAALAEAGGARAGASEVRAAERKARDAALGAIVEASASWKRPENFVDLADGLFRDAVRARDWRLVYKMAEALTGKLTRELGAVLNYAAARALELGYYAPAESAARGAEAVAAEARSRFLRIASDPTAGLHYRALAAWRSGSALSPLAIDRADYPAAGETETPTASKTDRLPEEESFALGFIEFGLADIAGSRARAAARSGGLGLDSLRRLGAALADAGFHDGSLRLATAYSARADWDPRRSDYELLYPRPYLEEYRAIRPPPSCPEPVLYGLLRSESLFRADVVSRAGAVGLSQLMPATAGDVARRLGIAEYDLTDPGDNLRLGAALFSSLLEEADAPLRAMMAYNAGRSRLRRWKAESGDLPDDLMLEAIDIAETRQYGRNILAASLVYGELYYGIPAPDMARYAIEGGEPPVPVE